MSQCLCARGCPAPKRAGFDYCGKACGNQSCTHPAAPSLIPSSASSPASQPPSGGAPPGPGMCQCPDCTNDACVPHNFCSMACEYGTCTHTLPSRLSSTNVAAAPSFQSGLSSSLASGLGNTPVVFVFYGGGGNTRTGSNSPTCDCARGCSELKNSPHHFCSRSCGAGTCTHPPAPPASSATTTAAPSSSAPSGPSTDECKCQGCTKPVAPGFPFCSRSCGSGACGHSASPSASSSAPAPAAPAAPAAPKCACPGCSQSAFTGYMFCGRKCALAGCGHLGAVAPTTTNTSSSSSSSSSAGPKCSCHGCNNTVHAGFPFCSRKCGSGACGHPPPPPSCRCPGCVGVVQLRPGMTNSYFEFCSKKCRTKECGHTHKPGLINKLSIANPSKFNEIKAHFASKWLHGTNCPNITEIYTVDSSSSKSKFEAYRQMIIAKRPHLATGTASRGPGNSRRRFHGTNQNCGLGITSMDPCSKSSCSVCQILKSGGLKISKAKSQTGWSRFGNGIYTTSTSSKANDYSRGSTKAIFVAEVIVGDAVKLTSDQPTLTQPPGGKDAVIGEVTPGGALNYDELIVYDDDACILQYLVHYN